MAVFSFFSFISLIADGPHHYHPACGHKGSSHLSPVHALQFFYRDASSAQLVNQWLNFTTRFSLSMEMSRLTRDGTAEPVSRDQILRHARGQGNIHFPCSADHEQDWQPYPVDPYSAVCDDHTYIHTYIHTYSRSHAFRYERKNTNSTLVRIELTTSVLADVQLTH